MKKSGMIFEIERCSMHDGPGIRTSVFFKGCPLRCQWCHNPESQAAAPQLAYYQEKCTGCGRCHKVCPTGAHRFQQQQHLFERPACIACGRCADVCPNGALRLFGLLVTAEQLMETIRKDKTYYRNTGGGLTVTGGEPFYQPAFLLELLKRAKSEGIHTCVETCGFASSQRLVEAIPYIDLFLYDYKITNPALHKKHTGAGNRRIIRNLDLLYQHGKPVILRCPVIPGINDTDEHFAGIRRLKSLYSHLSGVEIMPYHDMGKGKANAVGQEYLLTVPTADEAAKMRWDAQI